MNRREALKRVGALATAPVLRAYHPLVPVREEGAPWKPLFLDHREAETVAGLAELIIPETDTPGARRANVHQYIDWILSEDSRDSQEAFRRGLRAFIGAGESRQVELLNDGGEFFERLKELTVEGYYRSEVGMKEELDFDGRVFVTEFDGCTHDEHLNWAPSPDGKQEA